MFSNLRIAAKLALGFALVLAIAGLIGAVTFYNTSAFMDDFDRLDDSNAHGAAYLADAQSALWQLRWDVAQFIAVPDPEERRKLVANGPVQRKLVEDNLMQFANTFRTDKELAAMERLRASFEKYADARPRWFELYGQGKLEEAAEWRARTITAFGKETVAAFGELLALQRETGDALQKSVVQRMDVFRKTLGALLAAALGAGVLIAFWITRSITRPLGAAVAVTEQVADGNLAVPIEAGARDEAGRLLEALGRMRGSLSQAVETIREAAEDVGTASRQIATGNGEMSSRTEQQASSLEETASSMEELTSTVRQNADNAKQANQFAIGASSVALAGGKAMDEVIATMGGISEASRRIADIIGVIESIAFQTNILALNAAVEAARAGEQGRGFAVVASEVRSLAQRSSTAAKEITDLIRTSVERVDAGTRLVQGAGRTMDEIEEAVKRVTGIMADIEAASREQLSGIEQVAGAVAQMDQVTQQNASLVEQTAAAAEHLAARAEQLLASVARFNLSHAGHRAAPAAAMERTAPEGTHRVLPAGPVHALQLTQS